MAEGVWPRLQSSHEKPHWISLDFSRWEEGSEDEGDGDEEDSSNKKEMMVNNMVGLWCRGLQVGEL